MDINGELNPDINKQDLSLETVNVGDIDRSDLGSVKKYAIFAGNIVVDKILKDPEYINEHNDIVGLACSTIAVSFDRIKNAEGITGVSKENLDIMEYLDLIMSSEAAINGNDSRQGAASIQSVISAGNLRLNEVPNIAKCIGDSNDLLNKIFSDPNIRADSGTLSYIVNNTIPIIQNLKQQIPR